MTWWRLYSCHCLSSESESFRKRLLWTFPPCCEHKRPSPEVSRCLRAGPCEPCARSAGSACSAGLMWRKCYPVSPLLSPPVTPQTLSSLWWRWVERKQRKQLLWERTSQFGVQVGKGTDLWHRTASWQISAFPAILDICSNSRPPRSWWSTPVQTRQSSQTPGNRASTHTHTHTRTHTCNSHVKEVCDRYPKHQFDLQLLWILSAQ